MYNRWRKSTSSKAKAQQRNCKSERANVQAQECKCTSESESAQSHTSAAVCQENRRYALANSCSQMLLRESVSVGPQEIESWARQRIQMQKSASARPRAQKRKRNRAPPKERSCTSQHQVAWKTGIMCSHKARPKCACVKRQRER